MRKIIIPAVIAKTQKELDDILGKIADNAELIQLDIMDGQFVPNHSLNFDFVLPPEKHRFEAHLMIKDPLRWINSYGSKVHTIIPHYEACKNPSEIIEAIISAGRKAAFAVNPDTSIKKIYPFLKNLDQVLIMTVHPGFYGSPFLPEITNKIAKLRQSRPDLDIEVDGGINPETIKTVAAAGANMFVSGSYLVRSDNMKDRISRLYKQVTKNIKQEK
jgi:ribulose-phosphate 3-epimerase